MIYRDAVDAARARRDALTRDLARMRDDRSREAQRRRRDILRELGPLRARLEDTPHRLALRVLSNVRIATPCSASWAAMTGDDRVRHCALCEKKVYDLSGLASIEAARLIVENEGNLCVRLHRRRDGTVITSDCDVGVRRSRRRRAIAAGVLVTASAVMGGGRKAIAAGVLVTASAVVAGGAVLPGAEAAHLADVAEPTDDVLMGAALTDREAWHDPDGFVLDEEAYLRDPMSLRQEQRIRSEHVGSYASGGRVYIVDQEGRDVDAGSEDVLVH